MCLATLPCPYARRVQKLRNPHKIDVSRPEKVEKWPLGSLPFLPNSSVCNIDERKYFTPGYESDRLEPSHRLFNITDTHGVHVLGEDNSFISSDSVRFKFH